MSEPQLPREVRRRLAIIQHAEEVTGNVAMTCRYYGISRQVYYRWLRRYQEQGIDGLRDLSRRPHHSPNATHVDVVGKILYLRQNYHFGPGKIAMYLKRYHDVEVSQSGVWRILKRLDLNRLPASQRYKRLDKRWKRYEKQLPGHQVQIDVKFVEPLKTAARPAVGRRTKYYQFTAMTTAPDCACCVSIRVATRKPRSSSSTASLSDCPFRCRSSRQTTVPNSNQPSTTTSWTRASGTATSNPGPRGLTAKWNDPTASTPKSSTPSSTAWSSTTPKSSTTNSKNGRTTTTTIAHTAASPAKHPTNDYAK